MISRGRQSEHMHGPTFVRHRHLAKTLALIAFAWMLPMTAKGQSVFVVPPSYPVGDFPGAGVAGDFNNDSAPDLAAANYYGNNVSVLLNSGNGTFQAAVNYGVGTNPVAIASADFNLDGNLDLAVVNYTDETVSILLGKGDGTFQPQTTYAAGTNPYSVAAGDVNGDGAPDLVIANFDSSPGVVSVLLGRGDGTFQPAVTYAAGLSPIGAVLGDFNHDGKLDIAAGNCLATSDTVSVLLGNGDGTFQPPTSYAITGDCPIVAAGDFNGDGYSDLAAATSNNTDGVVNILIANAAGGFLSPVLYASGLGPEAMVASDVTGDGNLDLVVSNNTSSNVDILVGKGNGTFLPAISYAIGGDPDGYRRR